MSDDKWIVSHGLDVVRKPVGYENVFSAPDVNVFRLDFASEAEARHFVGEMYRYLGRVLVDLSARGVFGQPDAH